MSKRSSNVIDPSIDEARLRRQRGVALAALLAGITILFIGMGAAASTWDYLAQDNNEQELLFRGMQIVKALRRDQVQKNERPPSLEYLVKWKFLRREYLDPMTEKDPQIKGQWRFIHDGQPLDIVDCASPSNPAQPQPAPHAGILSAPSGLLAYLFSQPVLATVQASDDGDVRIAQDMSGLPHTQSGRVGNGMGGLQQGDPTGGNSMATGPGGSGMGGQQGDPTGGNSMATGATGPGGSGMGGQLGETTGGPIIGVRSRLDKQSLRVFWGKNNYKDWCFTDQTIPDSVVSIERMTDPKGGPAPQFENVQQNRHPWTPPER